MSGPADGFMFAIPSHPARACRSITGGEGARPTNSTSCFLEGAEGVGPKGTAFSRCSRQPGHD